MNFLKLGLISRIALLVVCVEILAFGLLGWFYVDRFSRAIDERTYLHLKLVGNMIARQELQISVISQKSVVGDLVGVPYLEGMVVGGNGRVIVTTNPAHLGQLASSIPGFDAGWLAQAAPAEEFIPGDNTLTAVMQARDTQGVSPMYTTVITISTAELNASKRVIAFWGMAGSLLFVLLSSAGIVLITQRFITRRINDSLAVMKKVEGGALDARIPVESNDELGQLQRGINSMTSKVGALLNQHRSNAEEMRKQKDLLASIIENAPIRVFWKDRELRYVGCNSQFARDAGLSSPEQVSGKTDFDMAWREQAELYRADDKSVMESGTAKLDFEETMTTPAGTTAWLSTSKVPLRKEDGHIQGVLGIYTDITSRKQAEDQIHMLAYFDALTALPNRTLLLDRLKQAMKTGTRSGNYGALLFIDLDNFKTLNDTLGHDMGDLLLKQVARRLQACVRAEDTVSRVGGDEFLVMLPSLGSNEKDVIAQVEVVGRKILLALNQRYQLKDVQFSSTPSIGATLFRGNEASVDDLLKQADLAMYKSKDAGRNNMHFFNAAMESVVMERAALEKDLREAIHENQLFLHYQAQVDDEGRAIGAEVLLRWQHPGRGLVLPTSFISLSEETGLILPLGHWVLRTACMQLAAWAERPELNHLTLAVNVSVHQFRQADFVDQVLQVLRETGAPAEKLKLELTESMLVSNVEDIIGKMYAIKAKGVAFSLDDFGTGYSSLSYLKRLPLDQLKIDQSFVRDMLSNQSNATIARTIVALAHSLGLGVIAEGVETASQREFLFAAGCHLYQGYFFSKPVSLASFEKLVLHAG